MDRLRHWAVQARSFAAYCGRRFAGDRCLNVAASLSYTTLLALVPLFTIAFSILSAFPVFDDIAERLQSFLLETFVAHAEQTVEDYLNRFTQRAGQRTAVGIAGLAVTALLLLNTIEASFAEIWRVARQRPLALRFVIYWAILTMAPLFLGSSLALSSYLFTLSEMLGVDATSGLGGAVLQLLPLLLIVGGLAVMYKFLPYRRVRLADALLGAVVGAVLFEVLKKGFGLYVANFPSYEAIYGALAAVPLFLVWMYLAWGAVLFGAEVAAAAPEWRARRFIRATGLGVGRERLALALLTLAAFAKAARDGTALSLDGLADATGAPPDRLDVLLDRLERARFVTRTDSDGWVLSRDLSAATLHDLYVGLDLGVGAPPRQAERRDAGRPVARTLDALAAAERKALADPLGPMVAAAEDEAKR